MTHNDTTPNDTTPNDTRGFGVDGGDDATTWGTHRDQSVGIAFSSRLWARLFAARYDRQLDEGHRIAAGGPLAAHYVRLASVREREHMAEALTTLMGDAGLISGDGGGGTRMPIRADVVRASADVVEAVLARLAGPRPVRARGVARLRILLSDGQGPVYRAGRGTFAAAMRGVLAAL
jgi:hypothetical protein